jgi:hypothetical protein
VCNQGSVSTCSGDAALFPSSIPDVGIVKYAAADTACSGEFTHAVLFKADTCVIGQQGAEMFSCATGGVNATATYNLYSGATSCTGTPVTTTRSSYVFDPTVTPPPGCQSGEVYTCQFEYGAASTTTISFVTMIVAFFVAFFAKQL